MDLTDKPIANPGVVLREEFDDWAILFNPDTAHAVGTNPVGVAIWKQMNGRRSVGEIASAIASEFQGTPDSAPGEVVGFVDSLAQLGFAGLEVERNATDA